MKTKFYFLGILLIIVNQQVFSQWKYNNPYPSSEYILCIDFANSDLGIAIGNYTPIRTENGGDSWKEISLGDEFYSQPRYFLSVFFADEQNAWIVGDSGLIIHSSNGGLDWEIQNSNTNKTLFSVFFIDEMTGWAVGGDKTIINTTDGGNTWTTQSSGNDGYFKDICFADANNGWCCGTDGIIYATTNGGELWTPQQSGLTSTITNINFVDENTGWALDITDGNSNLIKTENGGNSWTQIYSFNSTLILDTYFINENEGYVTGIGSTFKTTDGGQSWVVVNENENTSLYSITGIDNTVWIGGIIGYGSSNNIGSYISRSTDNGVSWEDLSFSRLNPYTTGYNIFSADFIDDNTGWIFAIESETFNLAVFQTTDKGEHWELKTSDNSLYYFSDNDFVNSTDGWGCNGWIYHTDDAGKTWSIQYQPSPYPPELLAIDMIDNMTGWCVGENGIILKTVDGQTWNPIFGITSNDIYDISFISSDIGWITGENGMILKTVDGGEIWSQQVSNTSLKLKCITFYDEENGWITGDNKTVLHTTDGGQTWVQQEGDFNGEIEKIVSIDEERAWILTFSQNDLFSTLDGGNTWQKYYKTFGQMKDITFTSIENGWIVGTDGLILHTENCGGLVSVNNFNLNKSNRTFSNFPNPFKANTTILYSTTVPAIVNVTVYNSLGEKITTLLNEFQMPGNYSVEWDGTGLPAGTYYCIIENEINTSVVKMLLVE